MNQNLFALFASRFPADKSRVFIEADRPGTTRRIITFAEFEATISQYANLILALAIAPGERVAVQTEKSPEALMLYLACLKAGVVYVPLNSAYREGEIRYFLENAEPKLMIHAPQDEHWIGPLCAELNIAQRYTLNEAGSGSWSIIASNASSGLEFNSEIVPRCDDDLAAILYTSGTTGRSKGAMITHRNLSSNALTLHQHWGFKSDDVLLHVLPLFHVHGLFVAAHTALLNAYHGGRMIFQNKFEAKAAVAALEHATIFMGVPTMYTRLLAEPSFGREACSHMRLFISGSAPLLAQTFSEFQTRTGHTILERYGMTETGMLTSNPLVGARKGGTVGQPLPGVTVRIVTVADADHEHVNTCFTAASLHEMGALQVGVLQVKGPNVSPGYWRMPEKNQEEFTEDGFFKTGDLGVMDADGYISIVGRSKDLIISGGYNIYPKEIELLIDALPGVTESAVIGLPHPDFGEAVAVVIMPNIVPNSALGAGSKAVAAAGEVLEVMSEAHIIAVLKSKLAHFKVPKRVFIVNDLPRNAMGKIQKNVLRKQYASTFMP